MKARCLQEYQPRKADGTLFAMPFVSERLFALRQEGKKALACFVTAGDQPLEHLPTILGALEAGGADLIELGLPFSDPIADGPTIQASSQRALDRGVRLSQILEAVREAQVRVPIITMGYANAALRNGYGRFAESLKAAGISGALISDMIPEEAGEWRSAAEAAGLDTVFLTAPTSTDARIAAACAASTGFVYCVSRTGVTGAENAVPLEVGELVRRVKRHTELSALVGFGISTAAQVHAVWECADGAVVGSYLVDLLHREWKGVQSAGMVSQAVAALRS